jgi:predicted MFS family arabinose efflux permease
MKSKKLILFTLALVNFTHIVDAMLIMPLGDIFIDLFQINTQQYSLLVSAYAIAAFFSSLFGVFFLDIFDRKKALLFLYAGFALGTFLCAFAQTYLMLVGLRFLTGTFGGIIGALVLSIISDSFPFKERGKAMGVLMAAFSAASALGVPIGIYLAAKGGWQWPFLCIGTLGLLIAVFIFFTFPSLKAHLSQIDPDRSFIRTIRAISSDPNQVNALIAGFVIVLAHFLIIPFISPYMIKNVGLSQMEISYQFFFGGLATVVTSPFIGRLVDRFGVMPIFSTVMVLSFFPTIMITHMSFAPLWYAILFTTLFFIFGAGRMIPPNTIITAATGVSNRGSFMSVKSALQQLAIAMASIISGMVVQINADNQFSGYHWVGYLSIVIGILSIYLLKQIKVAQGN